MHDSGLSWWWSQAPLELCLSSRLVCRTLAWPNNAQAVLGQSKVTELNKLCFLFVVWNRKKNILLKKSTLLSFMAFCYLNLNPLSNRHTYESYMLMIDLSKSKCVFKERKLNNYTLDYSLSSYHSCTSTLINCIDVYCWYLDCINNSNRS